MATMEAPVKSGAKLREGTYTFQLIDKILPRHPGEPPFPRKKELSSTSMSWDTTQGRTRRLRLVPGVESLWVDDQEKTDQKYARANAWSPVFENGVLVLEYPRDADKIQAMLLRDEYDGKDVRISRKGPVYTLVNKEMQSESELEFRKARHKAEGIALNAAEVDMYQHCSFLDIPLSDNGRDRTEGEIRNDYMAFAANNPLTFLKTVDSQSTKVTAKIKEAIKKGIIDMSYMKNQAHWGETKALITTLDPKKKSTEALVEFAMSKDGAAFMERLNEFLK